jgi:hypothetical protein
MYTSGAREQLRIYLIVESEADAGEFVSDSSSPYY